MEAASSVRNRLRGVFDKKYRKAGNQSKADTWEAQVKRGELLERLLSSNEWTEARTILESLKAEADHTLHSIANNEHLVLVARSQWCAHQAFLREIRLAIETGRQAKQKLAKVRVASSEESDRQSRPV